MGMTAVDQQTLLAYLERVRCENPSPAGRFHSLLSAGTKWVIGNTNLLFRTPKHEPVDVLFLHHYPEEPRRLEGLLSRLREAGLSVAHEIFSTREVLARRKMTRPDIPIHRELLWVAAHATYLVRRYTPRVLVTLDNGLIISPFLRRAMAGRGVYVNLSHGVTPVELLHSMTDFDYYFVFGQSSVERLMRNKIRIGSTRVLLSGSPFTNAADLRAENMDPERRTVLFFSTSPPPGPAFDYIRRGAQVVLNWARRNPQNRLLVKLHPLEDEAVMRAQTAGMTNVMVLAKDTSLQEALSRASLVVHSISNASLEAAMVGLPSVIVNDTDDPEEYLQLEDYFPSRAKNEVELNERVIEVFANYGRYVEAARRFVRFHIDRGDSVDFIAEQLIALRRGEQLENWIDVDEELSGL